MKSTIKIAAAGVFAALFLGQSAESANEAKESILGELPNSPMQTVSTVPSNGDTNPYGVAFVPEGFPTGGLLEPGDILVSNFNNSAAMGSIQGTGTTIVKINPALRPSLLFEGTEPLGLTTALGVLRAGFVLVGNVPNTNGTVQQGSLLVLSRSGKLVAKLSDAKLLNGPWDLAINDQGLFAEVFFSNVLSGTVTRLDTFMLGDFFQVLSAAQIASGYAHFPNMAALVVGPTGLAYDAAHDLLYVASTGDNEIFAISDALTTNRDNGTGKLVYNDPTHLHGPLGLSLAPNGDLITANGDAVNPPNVQMNQQNQLVEFTPAGQFVAQFQLDSGAPGAAFGIAIEGTGNNVVLAAVDDNTNSLEVWNVR